MLKKNQLVFVPFAGRFAKGRVVRISGGRVIISDCVRLNSRGFPVKSLGGAMHRKARDIKSSLTSVTRIRFTPTSYQLFTKIAAEIATAAVLALFFV